MRTIWQYISHQARAIAELIWAASSSTRFYQNGAGVAGRRLWVVSILLLAVAAHGVATKNMQQLTAATYATVLPQIGQDIVDHFPADGEIQWDGTRLVTVSPNPFLIRYPSQATEAQRSTDFLAIVSDDAQTAQDYLNSNQQTAHVVVDTASLYLVNQATSAAVLSEPTPLAALGPLEPFMATPKTIEDVVDRWLSQASAIRPLVETVAYWFSMFTFLGDLTWRVLLFSVVLYLSHRFSRRRQAYAAVLNVQIAVLIPLSLVLTAWAIVYETIPSMLVFVTHWILVMLILFARSKAQLKQLPVGKK